MDPHSSTFWRFTTQSTLSEAYMIYKVENCEKLLLFPSRACLFKGAIFSAVREPQTTTLWSIMAFQKLQESYWDLHCSQIKSPLQEKYFFFKHLFSHAAEQPPLTTWSMNPLVPKEAAREQHSTWAFWATSRTSWNFSDTVRSSFGCSLSKKETIHWFAAQIKCIFTEQGDSSTFSAILISLLIVSTFTIFLSCFTAIFYVFQCWLFLVFNALGGSGETLSLSTTIQKELVMRWGGQSSLPGNKWQTKRKWPQTLPGEM